MGLSLRGATSGAIDINAPAVAGDNTITLPSNNGSANQLFKNSGTAGIVTYSSLQENPSGDVSIAGVTTISGYVDATSYINTTGGLFSTGLIQGRRTDSTNEVFRGQDSSSTRTSFILGNGNASFVGKVEVGPSAGIACTISAAGAIRAKSIIKTESDSGFNAKAVSAGQQFAFRATDNGGNNNVVIYTDGTANFGGTDVALDDTGIYLMDGANASSSNYRSRVLTDGSAAFGSGAATISASGAIGINRSSESNDIIVGQLSGTDKFKVKASGDTTIRDLTARTVTSSDQVISNRSGTSVCFRAQDSGTDSFTVAADGTSVFSGDMSVTDAPTAAGTAVIVSKNFTATPSAGRVFEGHDKDDNVTTKINADGSVEFAGHVKSTNGNGSAFLGATSGTGVAINDSGNTTKIELNYDGSASFAGAVKIGGTAAANEMDEYEEGTWTPVFYFGGAATGVVFSMQEGHYVKIGRQVIAQFRIELSNKGSSTGSMTISTPFAVLNTFSSTGIDGNTLVGYTSGMSSAQVGNAPVSGYCEGGTSLSYFTARLSTGDAATLNQTDVDNDFSIAGTMFFYAA